MDTISQKNFVQ